MINNEKIIINKHKYKSPNFWLTRNEAVAEEALHRLQAAAGMPRPLRTEGFRFGFLYLYYTILCYIILYYIILI